MLKVVRSLLGLQPAATVVAEPDPVATATAALLYKMATADFDLADEEQRALKAGIEKLLGATSSAELDSLLDAARSLAPPRSP